MALYDAMMTPCKFKEKVRLPDGMGGWRTVWSDGATFNAAIHKDNTIEGRLAEKEGFTEVYTVTVPREVPLEFHDVFVRISDGQVFRITSNIKDNQSPAFSGINFGQANAEAWVLE